MVYNKTLDEYKRKFPYSYTSQASKETDRNTFTPLVYHVTKLGWFIPIVVVSCDESRLKNNQDP